MLGGGEHSLTLFLFFYILLLAPDLGSKYCRIGYNGLVTELQQPALESTYLFSPEPCGILYVPLHDFVFVFRVQKIVSHFVLNI